MPGGVDEVDEEARAIFALLDEVQVVLRQLVEEGDSAVRADTGQQGGTNPAPSTHKLHTVTPRKTCISPRYLVTHSTVSTATEYPACPLP